jgi:hypothetical protein
MHMRGFFVAIKKDAGGLHRRSASSFVWSVSYFGRDLNSRHVDEIFDALEISQVLRRGLDRSGNTFDELGMQLVDPLGPDASAAAFGQFLEIGAANIKGSAERLVHHEQPLQRLACPGPGHLFID